MEIRILEHGDLKRLLELFAQLNPRDEAVPEQLALATWQALLERPGVDCYGGFVDGVLVSTCTLVMVPNLTRGCRSFALIENVVTDEAYRARGIGGKVVRHAVAHAFSCGCYKVMLMTGRKDEALSSFYQGVGFDRNEKLAFVARPAA